MPRAQHSIIWESDVVSNTRIYTTVLITQSAPARGAASRRVPRARARAVAGRASQRPYPAQRYAHLRGADRVSITHGVHVGCN
eukprot:359987-Pleurochrysis_carterae.AAC.2